MKNGMFALSPFLSHLIPDGVRDVRGLQVVQQPVQLRAGTRLAEGLVTQ